MDSSRPTLVRVASIPRTYKNLLIHQLRVVKKDFEIVAIASSGKELEELTEQEGIATHAIEMPRKISPFADLKAIYHMYRFLKKERPLIIHSHTPKAGLIAMLGGWLAGVPVRMHTVAGLQFQGKNQAKKKLLMTVEKMVYSLATHIHPNSYGLENYILSNRLASPEKIEVVGKGATAGIDLERFQCTEALKAEGMKKRREAGIPDEAKVFLFLGRIVRDKGIEELLWAFQQITAERKEDIRLIILGIYEAHLDPISPESIAIFKEHPGIHYLGFQRDVRPFFCSADFFVFPSYREGLSNALMEACALEMPIVASKIIGNTDVIEHEKNGLLVESQSKEHLKAGMDRILDDETLRRALKEQSRKVIAEKYDRNFVLESLRQMYHKNVKSIASK